MHVCEFLSGSQLLGTVIASCSRSLFFSLLDDEMKDCPSQLFFCVMEEENERERRGKFNEHTLNIHLNQVAKIHVVFISFETLTPPAGVSAVIKGSRKSPEALSKEIRDACIPSKSTFCSN